MNDAVLLELIDLCYAAVDDKTCWQTFITKLAGAIEADAGDLVLELYDQGVAEPLGTIGFDPHFRESYDDEFLNDNPWILRAHALPVCKAFTSQFEPANFEKTDYYNCWLRPQGLRHGVGAMLDRRPDRVVHLGFVRSHSHGSFLHSDAASLDRIIPHVRRAVDLSEKLRGMQPRLPSISDLVDQLEMPALLLDREGHVSHMNQPAETLVQQVACPLSVRAGHLCVDDVSASNSLERALACSASIELFAQQSVSSGTILVPKRHGMPPPLVLKAYPLRAEAQSDGLRPTCLLLINDPSSPIAEQEPLLRLALNLTETEAALAMSLANGERISEYAARTGISSGTARWHLKNIQAKTDTNRTEDIVRLVHSILLRI